VLLACLGVAGLPDAAFAGRLIRLLAGRRRGFDKLGV